MNRESIPPCKLTTDQTREQEIFLRPVRIRLIKIIKYFITFREKKNYIYFFSCLHYFGSNEKLKTHTMDCGQINDCAIRLPSEDDK